MTDARPILGADPGLSGALAFLYDDGRIEVFDTPVVANEVDADALVRIVRERAPRLAVVERGQSMPRQGVASTFRYGVACGTLRAVVALCNAVTAPSTTLADFERRGIPESVFQ